MLSQGFEAIAQDDLATVLRWAVLFAVVETVRMATIHYGALVWMRAWVHMQSFLRANLLAAQVASGGPQAGQPVGSAGEALTHFRDDAEDIALLVDGMVDVSGGVVFTVAAGFLLGAADATGAAILVLPLLGVAIATRALDGRIKAYRAADREATAKVTGLVGDIMAAATTVKVNAAGEPLLARLRRLVDERRDTAVRDRVLDESVFAFSHGAADVGLGLVLIVSAGALASGAFDVGTLALFVSYLGWLSFMPRMVGRVLARRKQGGVAFDRMRRLVAEHDARNTVLPRDLPLEARQRDRVGPPVDGRPPRVPLERLEVVGLSARYAGGRGVQDVTMTIRRGQFVVVTGPVGAGKSTLLRAILGLVSNADASGEVRWNGVADRRPRRLLRPAERGLPAAGAPARVGLGARQRRPRSGAARRPGQGAGDGGHRRRHRRPARR